MKSVLFPFLYETEFRPGYSWSLELATRLNGQLTLFTAIPDKTLQYLTVLYQNIIKAKEYHIRSAGVPPVGKRPQPILTNFVKGDFEVTLLHLLEEMDYDVVVLPEQILPDSIVKTLVSSHKHIIALPTLDSVSHLEDSAVTRDAFFIQTLHRSSCYNLPNAFFKTVSEDRNLFNSLASFFTRKK